MKTKIKNVVYDEIYYKLNNIDTFKKINQKKYPI